MSFERKKQYLQSRLHAAPVGLESMWNPGGASDLRTEGVMLTNIDFLFMTRHSFLFEGKAATGRRTPKPFSDHTADPAEEHFDVLCQQDNAGRPWVGRVSGNVSARIDRHIGPPC